MLGHLMWTDSLEKTLMLWKIEGKGRGGQQSMRPLDSITESLDVNLCKIWETVEDRGAWHAAVHGVAKNWTWLSNWTTIIGDFGKNKGYIIFKIRYLFKWSDNWTPSISFIWQTVTMGQNDINSLLLRSSNNIVEGLLGWGQTPHPFFSSFLLMDF